jgi:hypothetical protein
MEEKIPNGFSKGMVKDLDPVNQPEGTYSYALNAILETREGSYGNISSEEGNMVCSNLDDGYDTILGSTLLPDNTTVYIVHGKDDDIIVHKNKKGDLDIKVKTACFNFKKCNPVDVRARLFKGCENVLYFYRWC